MARWAYMVLLVVSVIAGGCDDGAATEQAPPRPVVEQRSSPSAWHELQSSAALAVPGDAAAARALADAIAQARATAGQARADWLATPRDLRHEWAVKWAAPTQSGSEEHVWVQPLHWSPYRIEGVLISEPVDLLLVERGAGEPVGFPIEELSDWVRLAAEGAREGGFTIELLEEHFGTP